MRTVDVFRLLLLYFISAIVDPIPMINVILSFVPDNSVHNIH